MNGDAETAEDAGIAQDTQVTKVTRNAGERGERGVERNGRRSEDGDGDAEGDADAADADAEGDADAAAEGNGGGAQQGDAVAGVLRQWRRVYPGLDTAPLALIGRLNRCAALLQQASGAPLRHEELTRPEFDILCTLRRVDRELTPGRLARETFASGAAVTKRLKELEGRGLVVRRPDERDRRVAHISLTDGGREMIDRLLPEQLGYEATLLSGLGRDRKGELSAGLGELLVLLEGRLGRSLLG